MKDITGNTPLYGKRIVLWLAALALILACVPTAPVTVPTLGPNEINFIIQQTADAAAMQTLTAQPTFTSTPEFTPTPKNTFTPEPTLTPYSTFVLPTPTLTQRMQLFRVKHDSQLKMFDFRSRTASAKWIGLPQTPEVVPLFAAPKAGSGTQRTVINEGWEYYMDALNGFDKSKLVYLKGIKTGLFNGAGFPNLESLTMGGNVVSIVEIQNGFGRVGTMEYSRVGSADTTNYTTRPDLVHKFVVVVWSRKTKSTYWVNTPKGSVYWPLVSKFPVWIDMDRVEPFPGLPMPVTAKVEQEILTEPKKDAPGTGETLAEGDTVTVVEYYPSGSQVWGRLLGGSKWIALFRYEKTGPTFFTTWEMETLPPP